MDPIAIGLTVVVLAGVAGLALWPTRHERSSRARTTSSSDPMPFSGLAIAPFHASSPTARDSGVDASDGGGDGGGGGGD